MSNDLRAYYMTVIESSRRIAADVTELQPIRDAAHATAEEYAEMVAQIDRRREPEEPLPKWYVRHAEEWAEGDMDAWAGA